MGRADLLHRTKIPALGGHGVDQVIGHLDILGDGPQAGLVEEIHLDHGQTVPRVFLGVEAILVTDATNHLVALVQQNRQQTLCDIPRNAGEEDFHGGVFMDSNVGKLNPTLNALNYFLNLNNVIE